MYNALTNKVRVLWNSSRSGGADIVWRLQSDENSLGYVLVSKWIYDNKHGFGYQLSKCERAMREGGRGLHCSLAVVRQFCGSLRGMYSVSFFSSFFCGLFLPLSTCHHPTSICASPMSLRSSSVTSSDTGLNTNRFSNTIT